ncbi:MAG: ribose-5-phosphate isomerase RpiA [Candidatus Binataceae bacterium]|nr:ribose-5-phosphate isomerase RpiA [Candidatus Binataceae bacterium]
MKVSSDNQAGDLTALAEYALRYVKPGFTIGLGTGRAASAFIRKLAESKITVRGVPTSNASEALARSLGIEIVPLGVKRIDADFDGADEVNARLDLIKGYGGALVREKVVAMASRRRIILVGAEKRVKHLGQRGCVPIEVIPFAVPFAMGEIARHGLKPKIRTDSDCNEILSDNGNLLLDCACSRQGLKNPARLERELLAIPGVVGTGLFIGIADIVLIGASDGSVQTLKRQSRS